MSAAAEAMTMSAGTAAGSQSETATASERVAAAQLHTGTGV
jgi:hypothetical protein